MQGCIHRGDWYGAVATKFSDTLLPYPHQEKQILPIIAEVATKFSPWLRPCNENKQFLAGTDSKQL